MKDALIEIKNNLKGIYSKVDKDQNKTNDLKHKEAKNNQPEQQEGKTSKANKDSVRSLWDKFKCTNICIMGVPEGEERN